MSFAELMPLMMAALGLAGYYLRSLTPKGTFWQGPYGHAVLSLCVGVIGAAASWLQAGQLTKATALHAAVACVSTWLAGLRPDTAK